MSGTRSRETGSPDEDESGCGAEPGVRSILTGRLSREIPRRHPRGRDGLPIHPTTGRITRRVRRLYGNHRPKPFPAAADV